MYTQTIGSKTFLQIPGGGYVIPALVRNLIYPLHERMLHRPTFSYLSELEKSQWLTPEALGRLQREKLAGLLRIAERHCPWHAERIRAADIDPSQRQVSLDDLQRLPTMNRADVQAFGEQMVWDGVPGGAQKSNTGGSSGTPLIFRFGRKRQASDAAGRMRARRWWGVEVGAPEVYLWGAPAELNNTDRIKTIRDQLFNQLVLNAFAMSPTAMDEYLDAIRRFHPHCLYGYASSVALLAEHAQRERQDMRLPTLKVVCVTGEPLYPEQRELISRVFAAPVANEFGSRDVGLTAHESPEGQLLLLSESIILEVLDLDGLPVAPGEMGEAVMTGLCSDAQPFIRYRTGDMVRLGDSPCRGGRGLQVIEEVTGRQTDFVVRRDGTIMHALALIYVLRAVDGIREFKIMQCDLQRIQVQVVPNSLWSAQAGAKIVSGIRARLGDDVLVDVALVDEIAPGPSGKHRYVVSRVPLPRAFSLDRGPA